MSVKYCFKGVNTLLIINQKIIDILFPWAGGFVAAGGGGGSKGSYSKSFTHNISF